MEFDATGRSQDSYRCWTISIYVDTTMKCTNCPLAGKDIYCPGEFSQTLCDGKDDTYKIFLENFKHPEILDQEIIESIEKPDHSSIEERMLICQSCEYYDKEKFTCSLCGCSLVFKIKNKTE